MRTQKNRRYQHTSLSDQDTEKLSGIHLESTERLTQIVEELRDQFDRVALPIGLDPSVDELITKTISFQKQAGRSSNRVLSLSDSRALVGNVRAIKDSDEIINLKQAGLRSSLVHKMVMQQKLIGKSEREISNFIEGHFLLQNMQFTSYETIVGSGERSTILHARATDRKIQPNELVLIDAGAEWNGYCADITRTLPSGRTFTQAQKTVYENVLAAQQKAISLIKPGATLRQIHQAAIDVLHEKAMPHSTSHWIGLDVHDPCAYVDDSGRDILLKAGMCFTVEPGSYVNGIGVRIEDDVVVTETGYELLTSAPKEIEEIEKLRSEIVEK